jgi:hypothetical protein
MVFITFAVDSIIPVNMDVYRTTPRAPSGSSLPAPRYVSRGCRRYSGVHPSEGRPDAQILYSEMLSKLREQKLSQII